MLKIIAVGAGYFAPFQIEAWMRLPEVEVLAICDTDEEKANALAARFGVPKVYTDVALMIEQESADVIDIITPPKTHLTLVKMAAEKGLQIICQKPLAPTLAEARKLVTIAAAANVRLIVHENFRFQPWYRCIKNLLEQGKIGDRIHQLYFRMRMGDGWQEDAYLARQPYFRRMPRLLVHETGIHFIDTFRYLLGDIKAIAPQLRRLNSDIAGEDSAFLLFHFENGARAIWDANRYNESNNNNARYTFGELLLEGNKGSIRLYQDGKITIQPLGADEQNVDYHHEDRNFAGDCVFYAQQHFVNALSNDQLAETEGQLYLKNMEWEENIYAQGVIE
ncbi:MAG: Gfo/Idh/MocA family oxidoreductase [Bacteroidota bacterium]